MILDADGKRIVIGGVYDFNIDGIEQVKVLNLSYTSCFQDFCGLSSCPGSNPEVDDEWDKLFILLKFFKGDSSRRGKKNWVYHLVDNDGCGDITSKFCFRRMDYRITWFDIWEPT